MYPSISDERDGDHSMREPEAPRVKVNSLKPNQKPVTEKNIFPQRVKLVDQ